MSLAAFVIAGNPSPLFLWCVLGRMRRSWEHLPFFSLQPTNCHQPIPTNQLPPANFHQPIATKQLPPTNCHQPITTNKSDVRPGAPGSPPLRRWDLRGRRSTWVLSRGLDVRPGMMHPHIYTYTRRHNETSHFQPTTNNHQPHPHHSLPSSNPPCLPTPLLLLAAEVVCGKVVNK